MANLLKKRAGCAGDPGKEPGNYQSNQGYKSNGQPNTLRQKSRQSAGRLLPKPSREKPGFPLPIVPIRLRYP